MAADKWDSNSACCKPEWSEGGLLCATEALHHCRNPERPGLILVMPLQSLWQLLIQVFVANGEMCIK